jgi:non-ribosomal peptide synthetase component E (peptide arylation enzyme)
MKPTLLSPKDKQRYLDAGYWTRDTQTARFSAYAKETPDRIACRDDTESLTWAELDAVTDRLAANLIALGLERDSRALVRMPSSCREMICAWHSRKLESSVSSHPCSGDGGSWTTCVNTSIPAF